MSITLYIVTFVFSLLVVALLSSPFFVEVDASDVEANPGALSGDTELLLMDLEHELLTEKIDEEEFARAKNELELK